MKKSNCKNCWEFWGCSKETRETCPTCQTNSGHLCLYFTPDFRPRAKRDFEFCAECPWGKKILSEVR